MRGEGCAVCLGGDGWKGEVIQDNRELWAFLDSGRDATFFANSILTSQVVRGCGPKSLKVQFSTDVAFWLILGSRAECWLYRLGLGPPLDQVHRSALY